MADQTEISRMRMSVTDAKVIKNNYTYLQEHIDALDLIDYLWQKGIIDQSDREQVEAEAVTRHRNKKLLDILLKRGPLAFSTFIYVLKHNGYQEAVIEIYKSTLNECRRHLTANQKQLDESHQLQTKQDSTITQQGQVLRERDSKINKQVAEIQQMGETITRQQQEIDKLTKDIKTLELERDRLNLDLNYRDEKLEKHLKSYSEFKNVMLMFKCEVEKKKKKKKKCAIM